jgi:NADPH:quinone reductase-like Zn-dependent oxidoreductase
MQALRLVKFGSDPELVEVPAPELGSGAVVVHAGGTGACHSYLHLLYDFGPRRCLPWPAPFTLGHESAGGVHSVGEGAEGLEIGLPVAVYGLWSVCPVFGWDREPLVRTRSTPRFPEVMVASDEMEVRLSSCWSRRHATHRRAA